MSQSAPEPAPAPAPPAPSPAPAAPTPAPPTPAPPAPAGQTAEQRAAQLQADLDEANRRLRETARELGTHRKAADDAQQAGQTDVEKATSRANRAEQTRDTYRDLAYDLIRERAITEAAAAARFRAPADALVVLRGSGQLSSIEVDEATRTVKDPKVVEELVKGVITPERKHWLLAEGVQPEAGPSAPQFGGEHRRGDGTGGEIDRQRAMAASAALRGITGYQR
jgi:hypothetical protein